MANFFQQMERETIRRIRNMGAGDLSIYAPGVDDDDDDEDYDDDD